MLFHGTRPKMKTEILVADKVILTHMRGIRREDFIEQLARKTALPLVAMLSSPEMQWVSLKNVNIPLQRRSDSLSKEMRLFFCHYNDQLYVEAEKLDTMVPLVNNNDVVALLSELKEHTPEGDVDVARKCIKVSNQLRRALCQYTSIGYMPHLPFV
ncbi:hypothetical protein EDD16DRAFT_1599334 [Pisolithus croceorrhizus]|nr:hypothetical protein EDD16DRAFT_1599334 [Pisolithus croceorrhizus]KAI6160268.1 hypothetical protein EDD17DRAFT_828374 [Pisolithus thermaeus]